MDENRVLWVLQVLLGIQFVATRILPRITVLAAAGLVLVMVGAVVYHVGRGEVVNLVGNVVLGGLTAYVGYGRWRREPITARRA